MKGKQSQKRVNPTPMITTITEMFNPVLKKPALKNVILTIIAIAVAKTFRINEIASRLLIAVKHQQTKQKRLLRCLSRRFPIGAVMRCWLCFVLSRVCQADTRRPLILIDETQLLGACTDAEIQDMKCKSHNEIIQRFCLTVYQQTKAVLCQSCEPVLIFDRGFARARYVIKFLKAKSIPFVMRV